MCDRGDRRRGPRRDGVSGLSLLLVWTLSPAVALGQTAEDYRARLDTLLSLWREAVASESEARPDLDTLAVGSLRLFVWPDNRKIVRDGARSAMTDLREGLGPDTALLARTPIFTRFAGDPLPPADLGGSRIDLGEELRDDPESIADALLGRIGRDLAARLDEELAGWIDRRAPLGPPSSLETREIYIDLATADSRAARRCQEGRLRACRDALAVDDLTDPISVWYAPEERRRLVARGTWYRAARPRARACTRYGSDDACLELLRSLPARAFWPLPAGSHRLLLRIALDRGGPNGYSRLIESEGPTIARRLSDAAGIDADSLVALWRSEVMAVRPEADPVSLSVALGGLVWSLVFFAAATRSTRWRRG